MGKYTCWSEGCESDHDTFDGVDLHEAAIAFAEGHEHVLRVIVADEQARRILVQLRAIITFDVVAEIELSGNDLFPDDPMPTAEAEAIRDRLAAGTKEVDCG